MNRTSIISATRSPSLSEASSSQAPSRPFALLLRALCVGLFLALVSPSGLAQIAASTGTKIDAPGAARDAEVYEANRVIKTYYLANVTQQNDANEILIALRNTLSTRAKIYLVESQNAIVLSATPDDQTAAQKTIADLDRPKKTYRLTFTLADSDNGKRVGIQHFAIIVAAGQRTVLKQGDKIPVATGTYEAKNDTGTQTQFQYLDIGLNFDATLIDSSEGLVLKSKVEESSVGQPTVIAGVQEPVIRQTVLEGTSAIKLGKPVTLGSLDVAGSTRHIDIEVIAEPVS